MATHSSIPVWRILRTEEPGGLQSMGSHRVRHDWSNLAGTLSTPCQVLDSTSAWFHILAAAGRSDPRLGLLSLRRRNYLPSTWQVWERPLPQYVLLLNITRQVLFLSIYLGLQPSPRDLHHPSPSRRAHESALLASGQWQGNWGSESWSSLSSSPSSALQVCPDEGGEESFPGGGRGNAPGGRWDLGRGTDCGSGMSVSLTLSALIPQGHLSWLCPQRQVALVVKNLPSSAGDTSLIPGLGRSHGEGNSNSLQYSCLGNPMDRESWRATVHGLAKELDTIEHNTAVLSTSNLHSVGGCAAITTI